MKKRSLISVKTSVTGDGDSRKYACEASLPMGSADGIESENAAARIMNAVNAQLDYAKSDLRLVLYDFKKKQYVKVTYND